MKKFKIVLGIALFLVLQTNVLQAQGCSDAGFCTINSFKPNANGEKNQNQIKLGAFYGIADYDIAVYGNYVEYNREINGKFGLDAKLTTLAQNGNNVSTFGLSDLFLNGNFKANEKLKLTIGAKIPLSNADKSENNVALPMDYQASLGTFDLIVGVGYEIKKLQLVAALQQPLTQNKNAFFNTDYPVSSKLWAIQTTNKFKRSGDVLVRASYPFNLNSKWKITPSLLPIYHLQNDKYTDASNIEREILDSKGLTLNGNVYLDYEINAKNSLQLNMGAPFLVRESRPDGLTRSFIANLEYKIRF